MSSIPALLEWRGAFTNEEVNALHAEAFQTRLFDESECNWQQLTAERSLGWVTARIGSGLVGFVNVVGDGMSHAWIQDVMVSTSVRRRGIGVKLVELSRDAAAEAKCEWLHVDFDDELADFYYVACGFKSTSAGLIALSEMPLS